MKTTIKDKILALKTKVIHQPLDTISSKTGRDTANSLSKAIRTSKEADDFKAEYQLAKQMAKMR
jgi:hypothetical protein